MGAEYEIRIITEEEAEKEKPLVPQPRKNPSPSSETPESKYMDVIDQKDIDIPVFFPEFRHTGVVAVPDGIDQFVGKYFRSYIQHFFGSV